MDQNFIAQHWYASVYDQFENQTNDVAFLLKVLGEQTDGTPLNILEVACGTGRICIPLAEAGHAVTGFDLNEAALLRCCAKGKALKNLTLYRADALAEGWGEGFDVVVLAGNLLMNIEGAADDAQAQRLFLRRAAQALRTGGHLYVDLDVHQEPNAFAGDTQTSSYFTGADDLGTTGRTVSYGTSADPVQRLWMGTGHLELTLANGQSLMIPDNWCKYIPTMQQILDWLAEAGFSMVRSYRDYTDAPVDVEAEACFRATLWAVKER
ncbi:MAG: class I SAM-dependent methyltransferase [Oscillospiraceae bacterium]|jgi:SAM-dependent methyltransferase|nr:class I SAM-dependent methyltransferase [Oscillospiraceae bacterium]